MPVFEYRGLNDAGKTVKGLHGGRLARRRCARLRKDGIFLTDVLGQAEGSRGAVRKGARRGASPRRDVDLAQARAAAASPPTTSPSSPASSPRCSARASRWWRRSPRWSTRSRRSSSSASSPT